MDVVAKRSLRVGLIFVCLALAGTVANAQNYRGEAVPVVGRLDAVEFSRLRFLTFAFGREGPMDAPLPTPPIAGREYFVEADIFGVESAASIRFELVDAAGRILQTLTMWKASDPGFLSATDVSRKLRRRRRVRLRRGAEHPLLMVHSPLQN